MHALLCSEKQCSIQDTVQHAFTFVIGSYLSSLLCLGTVLFFQMTYTFNLKDKLGTSCTFKINKKLNKVLYKQTGGGGAK